MKSRFNLEAPLWFCLEGEPVFPYRHNVVTDRFSPQTGYGITTRAQRSIIPGSQYLREGKSLGVRSRLCYGEQSVILIELSGPRVVSFVWTRPITNPHLLFWFNNISRDHSKPVQTFRLLAPKMHLHSMDESSWRREYASKVKSGWNLPLHCLGGGININ